MYVDLFQNLISVKIPVYCESLQEGNLLSITVSRWFSQARKIDDGPEQHMLCSNFYKIGA